ncbi:glycosyl hydrolase 53 family protein [Hymenobacter sp. BT770]|uniref:glycosyl hydrolase 53 family protein n=1 Tax=Hymenobacter sp. BT770 TaxID=2886942 RepID=UPI001D12A432|nr:glycosyl hydrolase 53 family protein [Hymenobacter sp. BT770]MCC3152082.1 glycosyl hydrolase 53 family protein [Hymenobacter sp. BT770]MDO3415235.1 glycosyl hydrolase 53 family protein [Hymenobacter sp. BT770]
MKRILPLLLTIGVLLGLANRAAAQTAAPFAKGADVSWVTEMEQANYRFYNEAGVPQDLFQLLHDHDMNTIRLRVWVNPAGGWNGKNDVVAKAIRAHNLGFRIMIDFHYSDSWADPGKQTKPAAWSAYTFPQLLTAVYDHTYDVLNTLKQNNIVPEWVQVGNETNDGMLWPEGRASTNMANFAQLVDRGYAAVKAVNPTSKVIVHVSNGFNNGLFRYLFDGLVANGARFDVIGMSLYPTAANWPTLTAQCQTNMNDMVTRYPGKEVMVVETGMPADAPIPTQQMLLDLMAKVRAVPGGKGLGVLYWEPQAYNWMGYGLGTWNTNGQPTAALAAFLNTPPARVLVYNPGFEYTGPVQAPLGWTTASTTGDADADVTQAPGYTGAYQLTHQKATAYQVRTYQLLTSVPNGTYTLRAWAKSSGGQTTCQLYANGFGGAEVATTIPAAANWTLVQVSGITVSNGQCEIGLRSDAHAGESVSLDDVEFVDSSVPAPAAQFTVDGQVSATEIGTGPGKYQLAATYAGNHLEADRGLKALYVGYTATTLNLMLVGSAESAAGAYRALVLYLNTPGRTGAPARVQLSGGSDGPSPLKHKPTLDMQADYGFRASIGSTTATANDVYFSRVSYVTGTAVAPGNDTYLGAGTKAGGLVTVPATLDLAGSKLAYFNTPNLTANTANSGLEIEIPLSTLGTTASPVTVGSQVEIFAAFTDSDGTFYTDVLPQIPGRTAALGANPDFTAIPGNQFITYELGGAVLASRTASATGLDFQVYPNPAQATASIAYTVPSGPQLVSLAVYNALGQRVRSLVSALQTGKQQFTLGTLPTGSYLVRLQIGTKITSKKLVVE